MVATWLALRRVAPALRVCARVWRRAAFAPDALALPVLAMLPMVFLAVNEVAVMRIYSIFSFINSCCRNTNSAPGRLGYQSPDITTGAGGASLDWDRRRRVTPVQTASQEAWPEAEPLGWNNSLR
jgi:hypothetical protein